MEKIIFRKFFYDLLSFFLVTSLGLSIITWVIQSVNYLDLISNDGHGFKVYFSFVALNFPKIFSKIIIFSYFISLFYIIQKYQSSNEILIFWTNGISKINLVNWILKISILFTIIQLFISNLIVPFSQDTSRDFIRSSNIDLFTSLITEKKFIDTVKDFTIFVEEIDEQGEMKNIFLKDSVDKFTTQVISAKSGKIIEKGSNKYLNLNYGQILDITGDNYYESKVIKFNNTTFNLSNFKTKTTTFPKIQELNSKILIDCIFTYSFGSRETYTIPIFLCNEQSSIKSAKELFNRSIKQIYILALGIIASLLIFTDIKNPKYPKYRIIVFLGGILCLVLSELNSEFLNKSILNNFIFISFPLIIFVLVYLNIINLNKKNI